MPTGTVGWVVICPPVERAGYPEGRGPERPRCGGRCRGPRRGRGEGPGNFAQGSECEARGARRAQAGAKRPPEEAPEARPGQEPEGSGSCGAREVQLRAPFRLPPTRHPPSAESRWPQGKHRRASAKRATPMRPSRARWQEEPGSRKGTPQPKARGAAVRPHPPYEPGASPQRCPADPQKRSCPRGVW